MLRFKLPDLDQKNKSKTGFYFPISLSVIQKLHKENYGLLIAFGIIMPSFDTTWCQESGLNIVGIPSLGFFVEKLSRFWNFDLIYWDISRFWSRATREHNHKPFPQASW